MNRPLLTIGIPNYNYSKFIKQCIDSVLSQNTNEIEIIISDNCSTDNSWEIISSYDDQRIKAFRQSENIGVIRNWDFVLNNATGVYFKLLPSDDWMPDDFFDQFNEYFEKYKTSNPDMFILGSTTYINTEMSFTSYPSEDGFFNPFSPDSFEKCIKTLHYNYPNYNVFKTDLALSVGGYKPYNVIRPDLFCMAAIILSTHCKFIVPINLAISVQRIHDLNDRYNYSLYECVKDELLCLQYFCKSDRPFSKFSLWAWENKISSVVCLSYYKYLLIGNKEKLQLNKKILKDFPQLKKGLFWAIIYLPLSFISRANYRGNNRFVKMINNHMNI